MSFSLLSSYFQVMLFNSSEWNQPPSHVKDCINYPQCKDPAPGATIGGTYRFKIAPNTGDIIMVVRSYNFFQETQLATYLSILEFSKRDLTEAGGEVQY